LSEHIDQVELLGQPVARLNVEPVAIVPLKAAAKAKALLNPLLASALVTRIGMNVLLERPSFV